MLKLVKKIAALLILLLIAFFPASAQLQKNISVGIYTGWSFGTGYIFRWHFRPYSDDYSINYHIGSYIQYNINQSIGLQLNFDYQNGVYAWELSHPSFPFDSGEERFDFGSLSLNGVVNIFKLKNLGFYLLAGGGLSNGEWQSFDGVYFNFMAGSGFKIFLSGTGSGMAITLGGSFHRLMDPDEWSTATANFLRLNIGVEF